MRVLLTGCAGFIGSHTVEALTACGAEVVGIDNFDPYYSPARKRANVAEVQKALGAQSGFQLLEGDLRDESFLDRVFAGPRFDAIVHLAAMPGVRASMDAPQLYVDVNLKATLALFEDLDDELEQPRRHLGALLGVPITTVALPHSRFDVNVLRRAERAGYEIVFTGAPELTPTHVIPFTVGRVPITPGALVDEENRFRPERLALHLFRRPHVQAWA